MLMVIDWLALVSVMVIALVTDVEPFGSSVPVIVTFPLPLSVTVGEAVKLFVAAAVTL